MGKKVIAMLSGGLDSLLAVKIMLEQGFEVIGLHFILTFTNSKIKKEKDNYKEFSIHPILKIKVLNIYNDLEYFKIIEKPKYGYGQGINPCIDCKIYMFKKAKELMKEFGASFIVTGEVLGQRPMSQLKRQMEIIEKEAGLQNIILRPLSALLLPETEPEKNGLVDRQKLFAISGRTRKKQMELAEYFGIKEYPTPGGGCMLTDKIFSKRVKDLFNNKPDYNLTDLHLLKIGRHFRINKNTKIIVGRNEMENKELEDFALSLSKPFIYPVDIPGPSLLIDGELNNEIFDIVNKILFRYSDASQRDTILIKILNSGENNELILKKSEREIKLQPYLLS